MNEAERPRLTRTGERYRVTPATNGPRSPVGAALLLRCLEP